MFLIYVFWPFWSTSRHGCRPNASVSEDFLPVVRLNKAFCDTWWRHRSAHMCPPRCGMFLWCFLLISSSLLTQKNPKRCPKQRTLRPYDECEPLTFPLECLLTWIPSKLWPSKRFILRNFWSWNSNLKIVKIKHRNEWMNQIKSHRLYKFLISLFNGQMRSTWIRGVCSVEAHSFHAAPVLSTPALSSELACDGVMEHG